jgi:hypothetical protein
MQFGWRSEAHRVCGFSKLAAAPSWESGADTGRSKPDSEKRKHTLWIVARESVADAAGSNRERFDSSRAGARARASSCCALLLEASGEQRSTYADERATTGTFAEEYPKRVAGMCHERQTQSAAGAHARTLSSSSSSSVANCCAMEPPMITQSAMSEKQHFFAGERLHLERTATSWGCGSPSVRVVHRSTLREPRQPNDRRLSVRLLRCFGFLGQNRKGGFLVSVILPGKSKTSRGSLENDPTDAAWRGQRHLEVPDTASQVREHTAPRDPQGNQYAVWRCAADFLELRSSLERVHPACIIPVLPSIPLWLELRAMFSRGIAAQVARDLERFLGRVLSHPVLRQSPLVDAFLRCPEDLRWMRAAGAPTFEEAPPVVAVAGRHPLPDAPSCRMPSGPSWRAWFASLRPHALVAALHFWHWKYRLRIDEWITGLIQHPMQRSRWECTAFGESGNLTALEGGLPDLEILLQTQEKLLRTLQVRVDRHERCANRLAREATRVAETLEHLQRLEEALSGEQSRRCGSDRYCRCSCCRLQAGSPAAEVRRGDALGDLAFLLYNERSIAGEAFVDLDTISSPINGACVFPDPENELREGMVWRAFHERIKDLAGLFEDARRALRVIQCWRDRYLYLAELKVTGTQGTALAITPPARKESTAQVPDQAPNASALFPVDTSTGTLRSTAEAVGWDTRALDASWKFDPAFEATEARTARVRDRYVQHSTCFYLDLLRLRAYAPAELAVAARRLAQTIRVEGQRRAARS